MNIPYLINAISFILISTACCFQCHHHFHRRRSEALGTSTHVGPSLEDKEVLREALHLLNIGKKTMGLSTENPELLMQLIENSGEKADKIQKVLKGSQKNVSLPNNEQYLVLSGQNGRIRVENYTNTTSDTLGPVVNKTGVDDIFKMVMEKTYPEKNGSKLFHKITIIESNQLKPFDPKQFPRHIPAIVDKVKRHRIRSLKRVYNIPRSRRKRTKYDSNSNYIFDESDDDNTIEDDSVSRRIFDANKMYGSVMALQATNMQPAYHTNRFAFSESRNKKNVVLPSNKNSFQGKEIEDTLNEQMLSTTKEFLNPKGTIMSENALEMLTVEKSLLAQLLKFPMNRNERDNLRIFKDLVALLVLIFLCVMLVILIRRKCSLNRTLEVKGANVIVKPEQSFWRHLGLSGGEKTKCYKIPFGTMDYQLVPVEEPELEWQSEYGEWLAHTELDRKGIRT